MSELLLVIIICSIFNIEALNGVAIGFMVIVASVSLLIIGSWLIFQYATKDFIGATIMAATMFYVGNLFAKYLTKGHLPSKLP